MSSSVVKSVKMEGGSRNNEETCPKLLDLISKERAQWFCKQEAIKSSDESKLELKLGPPGEERHHKEPLLSLGCGNANQQSRTSHNHNFTHAWFMKQKHQERSGGQMVKESSQYCCNRKVGAVVDMHQEQKQKQQQQTGADSNNDNTGTAVATSCSQKRTAPGPVVGWPPIRSFRKNLAATNNSSKPPLDGQNRNENPNKKAATEKPGLDTCKKGLFVKINMDGVPIGRKVDLKAYNSYEKLSAAVDELFRCLLAAQRDSSGDRISNKKDEEEGILKGSGEYTLVYEDNEGDRMLVGDVPWHMFVSTVKRLRVLKSSEVSALSLGDSKQEKIAHLR